MTVAEMRREVAKAYPGRWPIKVAMMHDNQVIAIYKNFEMKGWPKLQPKQDSDGKQLSIFDVFGDSILPN